MGLISRVSSRTYRSTKPKSTKTFCFLHETKKTKIKMPKVINERTFIAVKPDGVQRGIVGNIISRFENRGYKLVAIKVCQPGKEHLEKHYSDLSSKPFFAGLVEYMNSGPICAMVWEGLDVVRQGRVMLGETNPSACRPGRATPRTGSTSNFNQTKSTRIKKTEEHS